MKPRILDKTKLQSAILFLLIACAVLFNIFFPDSRLYWPFMLSAYWIGIFVYLWEVKQAPDIEHPSILDYLFPRKAWLDPSTFHDGVICVVNFVLLGWVAQVAALNPEIFQTWAKALIAHLPNWHREGVPPPSLAVTVIFVVVALLLSELFFYWSHRWQHTIPALWEFHKVHHSAEVMTPLTLYRQHPAVVLFPPLCRYLGLGLALGFFACLYPDVKTVSIIAGEITGVAIFNAIGGNLQHSHIWMRFPRLSEYLLCSPAMHQIHHSTNPDHFGKNYGTLFSFWDWVFGSIYVPKTKENLVFGLGHPKQTEPFRSLWGLYVHPFRAIGRHIFKRPSPAGTAKNPV